MIKTETVERKRNVKAKKEKRIYISLAFLLFIVSIAIFAPYIIFIVGKFSQWELFFPT